MGLPPLIFGQGRLNVAACLFAGGYIAAWLALIKLGRLELAGYVMATGSTVMVVYLVHRIVTRPRREASAPPADVPVAVLSPGVTREAKAAAAGVGIYMLGAAALAVLAPQTVALDIAMWAHDVLSLPRYWADLGAVGGLAGQARAIALEVLLIPVAALCGALAIGVIAQVLWLERRELSGLGLPHAHQGTRAVLAIVAGLLLCLQPIAAGLLDRPTDLQDMLLIGGRIFLTPSAAMLGIMLVGQARGIRAGRGGRSQNPEG